MHGPLTLLLDLVGHLAILVTMMTAYRMATFRWRGGRGWQPVFAGLLFGTASVFAMLTPVRLMDGLIFDGRSIILAVAGFVGGPIVALVSAGMATVTRVSMGGVGMVMGVGVIAESAIIGVAFHHWRSRTRRTPGLLVLWGFGLAVHGVMALLLLVLPGQARGLAWSQIASQSW